MFKRIDILTVSIIPQFGVFKSTKNSTYPQKAVNPLDKVVDKIKIY